MPSFEKRSGRIRCKVTVNGRRESATFDTKAEAKFWAEAMTKGQVTSRRNQLPFSDVLLRYSKEVSPTRAGHAWETIRINRWRRQDWTRMPISSIQPMHMAQYRDDRLREVSAGTVLREFGLLSAIFERARRDWQYITTNPVKDVVEPTQPPDRRRRITDGEIDALLIALDYRRWDVPVTKSHRVALSFLLALETGMRSGEILGLTPATIFDRKVHLPRTKNGMARDVPLSAEAVNIIGLIPRGKPNEPLFGLTSASRDALFRKARDKAGIDNMTFHDSRAEAVFRLSKKLNVLELAAVIGHRDISSLQFYYRTTAEELADKL